MEAMGCSDILDFYAYNIISWYIIRSVFIIKTSHFEVIKGHH